MLLLRDMPIFLIFIVLVVLNTGKYFFRNGAFSTRALLGRTAIRFAKFLYTIFPGTCFYGVLLPKVPPSRKHINHSLFAKNSPFFVIYDAVSPEVH